MAGASGFGSCTWEEVCTAGKITEGTRVSERGQEKDEVARVPSTLEEARAWMDAVSKGSEEDKVDEFPVLADVYRPSAAKSATQANLTKQHTNGVNSFKENGKGNMVNKKTFADKARASASRFQDVFVTSIQALQPVNKGEFYEISIPDNLYQEQLQKFSFSLIARLLLNKGASPIPIHELKKEIQSRIGLQDSWNLVSLGKAFFTLQLSSTRDQNLVRSKGYWVLAGGVLKIRDWVPDFNPFKVKTTVAPIWVRIYNLPFEYWHSSIITGISKALGNPLKMDGNTASGSFGSFARVLVEIDLMHGLQESVVIARGNVSFSVEFEYENVPYFCGACHTIGHLAANCKRIPLGELRPTKKDMERVITRPHTSKKNASRPLPNKKFDKTPKIDAICVADNNKGDGSSRVATTNSFDLLSSDEDVEEETRTHIGVDEEQQLKEPLKTPIEQVADRQYFENEDQFAVMKSFEQHENCDKITILEKTKLVALLGEEPMQEEVDPMGGSLQHFNKQLVIDSATAAKENNEEEMQVMNSNMEDREAKNSNLDSSRVHLSSISKANSDMLAGSEIETPFVTKRRGRLKKVDLDNHLTLSSSSRLHKASDGQSFSSSTIARHNMSSVVQGDFNAIIDTETGRSPKTNAERETSLHDDPSSS